jgi:hypothetical protein
MGKSTAKATTSPDIHDVAGVIQFEPCSAPQTKKVGLDRDNTKPRFSLRKDGGRIMVYGVEDCRKHGVGQPVRLNSYERYTSDDYLDMMRVQWLHLFAAHRGKEEVSPVGVVSVPISVYNEKEDTDKLRALLLGSHQIQDADGCELKIRIDEKKLVIIPESVGALYHYAFDPRTLDARGGEFDVHGNVLVVDVGYLTTDFSLHTDMQYQRAVSFTAPSLGMGQIALAIQEELQRDGRIVDISQIDAGMRGIAEPEGEDKLGAPKSIQIAGNYVVDVGPIYDAGLQALAFGIRDVILNRFPQKISLILLCGGGAIHLKNVLRRMLPLPVAVPPDPAAANVLGAYTRLARQIRSSGKPMPLLWSGDNGNGTSKGVSSETL